MLIDIINKAYGIFGKYQAVRPLDVCTESCCMKPEDEARLASLPVREIPIHLLREYNDSAKPEKTRIEEVKHFLPRYMELVAGFEFPSHSTELSFSRLVPFDKAEWPKEELQILEMFTDQFFLKCLHTYPIGQLEQIDAIVIMCWNAGFDIDRLLHLWEQADTTEGVLHFKDLYFNGFDKYDRTKMGSGFGSRLLCDKLRNWIDSESVRDNFEKRIEKIILSDTKLEEGTLNELELLYDIVRSGKRSV